MQIHKLDNQKLKSRFKTSIYIALYYLLLFILASFSDPRGRNGGGWTWWCGQTANAYISYICAILFMIALLPLVYFIAKELNSCFIKTTKKIDTITIAILIYLIQFIPTIVYIPFSYSSLHWKTSPQMLTYIFIGSSALLPIISYFILFTWIKKTPSKTKFNVIWFPILTVFIGLTFEWLQYLALIRYWSTLFILLICTVGTDIFGYFFGSIFGKHHFSKTSPKKTIEGVISGTVLGTCFALLILYLMGFAPNRIGGNPQIDFIGIQIDKSMQSINYAWWIVCTLIIVIICLVSVGGDLFFSWFKRKNNIKDFSNILKEHGGILDRIDSLILVISFFGVISTIIAFIFSFIDNTNLIFPVFENS